MAVTLLQPTLQASESGDAAEYSPSQEFDTPDGFEVPYPEACPSSQLDNAQRSLETSAGHPWVLRPERFGSTEHHDGFSPSLQEEAKFRHQSWAAPRRRIYQALLRTSAPCRRIQHFADCGSQLWFTEDGSEIGLACNHCHDRLCLMCQKTRQAAVVEGVLLRLLDSGAAARFITLTLKHSDSALTVQLERLVSCFKSLRKHKAASPALAAGTWFIEVKLSKDKARWHPHLHIIAEGQFIHARDLSKAWHEVTGDSYITDIRAIGDVRQRAMYVTKYATKPLANEVTLIPAKLDEFVTAIKGKRLYQSFGAWAKPAPRDDIPRKPVKLAARVTTTWELACSGDIDAIRLMHRAHAKWPVMKRSFPLPPQYALTPKLESSTP